jgi:hypothetical protein
MHVYWAQGTWEHLLYKGMCYITTGKSVLPVIATYRDPLIVGLGTGEEESLSVLFAGVC